MRFGEILAQCRKQRGLNQAELAEKLTALGCEVSNQAVSKWEKDMTLPSARQFLTLCDVLEIEDIRGEFSEGQAGLLRGLNPEGRRHALDYIQLLRESGRYAVQPRLRELRTLPKRSLPLYSLAVSAGTGQFLDGEDYEMASKYHVIVPIIFGGKRVATLLLARPDRAYNDEDIAICEYGATVIGLEVTRGITMEEEADSREKNAVNMALETLSYSELDAVTKIFAELEGNEGLLVASKIADKSGITRSVIVNALRKLESAGVIESRSLGMKGTRIKITNEFLRGEIDKIEI